MAVRCAEERYVPTCATELVPESVPGRSRSNANHIFAHESLVRIDGLLLIQMEYHAPANFEFRSEIELAAFISVYQANVLRTVLYSSTELCVPSVQKG